MDVSEGAKGILEEILAEVIAATNHRLASFGFPPGVGALAGSVALGVTLNLLGIEPEDLYKEPNVDGEEQ